MTRRLSALLILMAAAACTPAVVTTVPGEPIQIGDAYSVTPQIEWNRPMMTIDEVWTVDGYALQMLYFHRVPNGQSMPPSRNGFGKLVPPEDKTPVFRKTMLPNEIQEFIVATLAADGWAGVKPSGLAPAKFGNLPGFRFAFSMKSEKGLEYDGIAFGAVQGDTLHVIVYRGTRLHYFPQYSKEVEKLFSSIRT